RDFHVTGVQTCALPICRRLPYDRLVIHHFYSLFRTRMSLCILPPVALSVESCCTSGAGFSFDPSYNSYCNNLQSSFPLKNSNLREACKPIFFAKSRFPVKI